MIISRTPFRISFSGGGTDLKEFYKHEPGAVTSTTIDKYMYITVNKRFDQTIRISYSRTEIVDSLDEITHPIVRETLRLVGLTDSLEITSIADVPAGTGLGSSSSFTVGLLHALYAYKGQHSTAERLADEACRIEIDILGAPIGKQDQYAAAYGGLQHIQFNPDESVYVDPVICTEETKRTLSNNLLLLYTGINRKSSKILRRQKNDTKAKSDYLRAIRDLSYRARDILTRGKNLDQLGEVLHQNWILKKQLADSISNDRIEEYYRKARDAGALGGKMLGAGGGGFLLLYCEEQCRKQVRVILRELKEVPFNIEPQGSKIIYVG